MFKAPSSDEVKAKQTSGYRYATLGRVPAGWEVSPGGLQEQEQGSDWDYRITDDGIPFFVNHKTKETSWEPPPGHIANHFKAVLPNEKKGGGHTKNNKNKK
jgi:hypothetical protein